MTIINPLARLRTRPAEPTIGPQLTLTGAIAAIVAVAAVIRHATPDGALAPGLSLLFFIMAAAVALIAWQRPIPARRFSYWDAAGILTFVGIGVAATVEPEQMVNLVAGAAQRP